MVTAPRTTSTGLLRVTVIVSSTSSMMSSVTATEMSSEVVPAVKVRVPVARVKSSPLPAAVPPVTV